MTPIRNFAVFVSMAALLASAAAAAVPETPSLKPGKAAAVQPPASVLSINTSASAGLPVIAPLRTTPLPVLTQKSGSVLYLARALSAAERNQWTELSALQYAAPDPVLKNLIMWKRASEGVPGMTFDELNLALTMLDGWPQTSKMRQRAEEIIELSALHARARVEWLDRSGPQTGAGTHRRFPVAVRGASGRAAAGRGAFRASSCLHRPVPRPAAPAAGPSRGSQRT